jgi:hypothetical protein
VRDVEGGGYKGELNVIGIHIICLKQKGGGVFQGAFFLFKTKKKGGGGAGVPRLLIS